MKKLSVKFNILLIFIALFLTLSVEPVNAQSASLYFSPSTRSVGLNQSFSISIMINTGGVAVNGVTADFTYPAARLEVVSIDSSSSEFSIQAEEDYTSAGTVYISRAISGGNSFTGTGVVAVVNFRSTTSGTSTLSFTNDAIITSASENPTNVLGTTQTATITAGSIPATGLLDEFSFDSMVGIFITLIGLLSLATLAYIQQVINEKFSKS